jgi:hypothetical protein
MQAKGPGPMPANSTMRTPVSGPLARCVEDWLSATGELIVSVTSKFLFLIASRLTYFEAALGLRRRGSLSVTLAAVQSLAFRYRIFEVECAPIGH